MKKIYPVLLTISMLCGLASFGYTQPLSPVFEQVKNVEKVHSAVPLHLIELENVLIDYSFVECHDNINDRHFEYAVLSFKNTTQLPITISYDLIEWYNDRCYNCEVSNENTVKSIKLKAGESTKFDCKNPKNAVVSKILNHEPVRTLTNFSINNLSIN